MRVEALGYFENGIGDFFVALPAMRVLSARFGRLLLVSANPKIVEMNELIRGVDIISDGRGITSDTFYSFNSWRGEKIFRIAEGHSARRVVMPSFVHDVSWRDQFLKMVGVTDFSNLRSIENLDEMTIAPSKGMAELMKEGIRPVIVHRDTKPDKCVEFGWWEKFLKVRRQNARLFCIEVGVSDGFEGLADYDARNMSIVDTIRMISVAQEFYGVDSCFRHCAELLSIKTNLIVPLDWEHDRFIAPRFHTNVIRVGRD